VQPYASHTDKAPDLDRLLVFLSINHYHAVQHELLRAGRAAQAWSDLSDKAREIKIDTSKYAAACTAQARAGRMFVILASYCLLGF
jgi:hypothetical protein